MAPVEQRSQVPSPSPDHPVRGPAALTAPTPGRFVRVQVVVDRPWPARLLVVSEPDVVSEHRIDAGGGRLQRVVCRIVGHRPTRADRPPAELFPPRNALAVCRSRTMGSPSHDRNLRGAGDSDDRPGPRTLDNRGSATVPRMVSVARRWIPGSSGSPRTLSRGGCCHRGVPSAGGRREEEQEVRQGDRWADGPCAWGSLAGVLQARPRCGLITERQVSAP